MSASAIVHSGALLAVSDAGPDNVWAVGYERQPGRLRRPIALRWTGSTWNRSESEGLPAGEVILTDVAMRSAMDGWAVGYARDSHGQSAPRRVGDERRNLVLARRRGQLRRGEGLVADPVGPGGHFDIID